MEIDMDNYHDFIENDIAVMNFFSDWHMNCLMVLPILEELAQEFHGRILFGKVNIDEAEEIALKHEVSSVPTIIIFRNKQLVDRMDNVNCEEAIRERIQALLQVC